VKISVFYVMEIPSSLLKFMYKKFLVILYGQIAFFIVKGAFIR